MPGTAQDAYLESRILTADPLELVRILYRSALDCTRRARTHLAAGRIPERSREICKTFSLISELTSSLDHGRGEAVSANLARLYDYLQRRLLEANARQSAEALAEVENLLTTMLAGWDQAGRPSETQPSPTRNEYAEPSASYSYRTPSYGSYAPVAQLMPETVEYSAQSWSF
jgi:flagellar protein FliS